MAETSAQETKTKLEVMAHFDKEASEFDFERTAAGYRLRHRLVRSLLSREYRVGAMALDVGCGTGEYTLSLAKAGFEVLGGDLSKGMLAIAKSKTKGHRLAQKIQFIRLESTKLPFRNEFFDTITCIALLDWVPDSYRLLAEINRVLRHRAKLIVCVDALWSPYRIYRKAQFVLIRRRKRYSRIFNSRELQRAFITCGFVVEKFFWRRFTRSSSHTFTVRPQRNSLGGKGFGGNSTTRPPPYKSATFKISVGSLHYRGEKGVKGYN